MIDQVGVVQAVESKKSNRRVGFPFMDATICASET